MRQVIDEWDRPYPFRDDNEYSVRDLKIMKGKTFCTFVQNRIPIRMSDDEGLTMDDWTSWRAISTGWIRGGHVWNLKRCQELEKKVLNMDPISAEDVNAWRTMRMGDMPFTLYKGSIDYDVFQGLDLFHMIPLKEIRSVYCRPGFRVSKFQDEDQFWWYTAMKIEWKPWRLRVILSKDGLNPTPLEVIEAHDQFRSLAKDCGYDI